MKKLTLLLLICLFSLLTMAHEFWLQPQKYFYSIREVAFIRFMVGEQFTGLNWQGNQKNIQQLIHYTPSGTEQDVSSGFSANAGDSLRLPLQEEGTHMVIFNSTNSHIRLEADKFNQYLKEDGLDITAAHRLKQKEETKEGSEYYQRSVKTLLQVGGGLTQACTKPTSLPLDIIPAENPYSIPNPGSKEGLVKVRFRVMFKNTPLNNALVKIWYRVPGRGQMMDTLRTNKKGWVTANRHPGPYMVSCVHMEPASNTKEADWQSYWGSLSFEYSQFFTGKSTR